MATGPFDSFPRGADVEIVHIVPAPINPADVVTVVPSRLRINGTDVGLIERDSIRIDVGDQSGKKSRCTTVTLTLQVRSLTIGVEQAQD